MMNKLLIIGLDGVNFDLITPWIAEGKLPHIADLMKNSVYGKLKSLLRPMSPPAWTSFMTGKNPGKHGIFDSIMRKSSSYEIEFVDGRWRKAETIWRIVSDAGKRVCILSVPATYPPEPINGVMISGIDTPLSGGVADPTTFHPPELYQEIFKAVGPYLISPNLVAFDGSDGSLSEVMVKAALQSVERKMETALYLYGKEPWDLFMIVIGETDGIAHRLWKYHDKKSPFYDNQSPRYMEEDPILPIYQKVDQYIGKLLGMASDDTIVMIASDHGHGGNSIKAIYLNKWLEGCDLLRFKTNINKRLLSSVLNLAKEAGLKSLSPTLRKKILRKTKLAHKTESWIRFSHIDWSQTKAYSEETLYFPTIWINVKGREPAGIVEPGKEYEALREHIICELANWLDPDTGQPVVGKVYRREEAYSGPLLERSADLVIEWNLNNGYSYLFKSSQDGRGCMPISRIDEKERERSKSGTHLGSGIFIASGKDLKRQTELVGAEIIDLVPTILYLLGLPIPSDMDGKILTQIFRDDYLTSHPVQYCNGPEVDGSLT